MTTPGDGSDFKGHLVHKPGRIEATSGAGEVCGEAFSETGRGLDGPDYCALPLGHEGPHNSWAKQPGAGEGERWQVAQMDGRYDSVWSNTPNTHFEVSPTSAPFLAEYLNTLHDTHEADQQTIADLRAETERWQEFANGYMRDLTAAEQTIAELQAERDLAVRVVKRNGGWDTAFDDAIALRKAERTIAELRKALAAEQ